MTPLELGALLAHPANGGLRVVVEAVGAFSGVVIAAREATLPDQGTGELAALTEPLPTAVWQQDALVRRVRDRGFRGLALSGAEELGAGTRGLAARLGVTVLTVDDPLALARAGWELVQGRDALTLGYVRRVAQSIEYSAAHLADLLRHLSSSVGHGVALIDAEGVLLQAGGELPASVRSAIDFGLWQDAVSVDEGAAASVRVDSPSRAGLRLAMFGVGLSAAQLSALAVAAEVAMPAVAARILIDEVADVSDAAVASGLLREFLEAREARDPDVEQRMSERGWRTGGYHLAFRIAGRRRLDTLELLRFVRRGLATLPLDSQAVTSGRGVTGWLSFAEPPSAALLDRHVASVRALHDGARRSFDVATGVGSLDSGAGGLLSSIDGAVDGARIAAGRAAMGWFVRVDALGIEQVLLSWAGSDTFVPAAESLLAPLASQGPELLETLTVYLDHESGVSATAIALGVHRNTVAMRIARAQELLGIDLADTDARLALHLACRALR